jgi:hypothetical protein
MSIEAMNAAYGRLLDTYEVLVPIYARGETFLATADVQHAASDFQRFFPIVAHTPLLPYYRALGKDFFTWLDRVSPPVPASSAAAASPASSGPSKR